MICEVNQLVKLISATLSKEIFHLIEVSNPIKNKRKKKHINRLSNKIITHICDLIRIETVKNLMSCIENKQSGEEKNDMKNFNDIIKENESDILEKKLSINENIDAIPYLNEKCVLCYYYRNSLLCEKISEVWIFTRITFDKSNKVCLLNIFYPYDSIDPYEKISLKQIKSVDIISNEREGKKFSHVQLIDNNSFIRQFAFFSHEQALSWYKLFIEYINSPNTII